MLVAACRQVFCARVRVCAGNSYAESRRSADDAFSTAPAGEPDDPAPPPPAQRALQDKEPAGKTVSRNRPIMRVDQGPALILSVSVHVSLFLSRSFFYSTLPPLSLLDCSKSFASPLCASEHDHRVLTLGTPRNAVLVAACRQVFCARVWVCAGNSYAESRRSANGASNTAPAAEPDDPAPPPPPPSAQRALQDKEPAGKQ